MTAKEGWNVDILDNGVLASPAIPGHSVSQSSVLIMIII